MATPQRYPGLRRGKVARALYDLQYSQYMTLEVKGQYKQITENGSQMLDYVFPHDEVHAAFFDYYTYSFFYYVKSETAKLLDGQYLYQRWSEYVTRNINNLNNIMTAFMAQYDPIGNYLMYESGTDGTKHDTVTETDSGTVTDKQSGTDTGSLKNTGIYGSQLSDNVNTDTFNNYSAQRDVWANGVDSTTENGTHTDREITTQNGQHITDIVHTNTISRTDQNLDFDETDLTELQKTGSKSETSTQYGKTTTETKDTTHTVKHANDQHLENIAGNHNITPEYSEVSVHYFKRSGNIGVTTSQQMIQSEIELRAYDVLREFVKRFANEYLVYWTEDTPVDLGCYEEDF